MRKTFFITIFTLLSGLVSAQTTNYKIFRKQNQHPTCTVLDSVIVNDVRNSLETYLKIKAYTNLDYWNMMHIHCMLGECQLSSQLHIEIQTYTQNGESKATAMAWHSPNSAYRAYKRRFDYIILNTPALHTKEQAAARNKLFGLYPDTLAMKAEYKRLLYLDSALCFDLLTMMRAIDAKGEVPNKAQFSEKEFFQVAARFFFIDSVFADSTFQTHICIGINGVDQINDQKDLTQLAAFCYEAIFSDFDREASVIEQVFEKHKNELEQKMKSGQIENLDIEFLRKQLYTFMAHDLVFQKVLLDAYTQNKANLAFKIKPNNAYVFHLIPSVKDNIYGIAFGPIGSEAICNAIKLRRTHGINIQLIGQGFFIPMNREEFAFEQILLPLDTLFFTTHNARFLHNGLLLSAFGTYTDFSNGIVLSAGCSFGRKVNGLAFNLFANKYYVANGVELGIQNQAHKVNGLQVGLFNRCVELNGLQIGLWNVNGKRKLPIVNW